MPETPGFLSRLFVTGAIAFLLTGLIAAIYGVALPGFERRFDLAEGSAGLILVAHFVGALVAVVGGIFGLRALTPALGLILLGGGSALMAAEPGWGLVLIGAAVAGFGFGLVSALVNQAFLTGFGRKSDGMVGVVNAVFGLGAIAAPLIFVWAGQSSAAVFASVAVGAAGLLAWSGVLAGVSPAGLPNLRQKRLFILFLNFFGVTAEVAIVGLGPTALVATGLSETEAAGLTSAFFVTFLLGRLSLYWVTRWMPSDWVYVTGIVGTGVCMALAAAGAPALGFVLSGAFVGITFPGFYVWATGLLGRDPRMGSAILTSGLMGAAVGPLFLGSALGALGSGALFWIVAALCAVVGAAAVATIGPARRLVARGVPA